MRRRGGAASGDTVRLLDERDADAYGVRGLGRRDEVARSDAASGTVPEHEPGTWLVRRMQVDAGRPVRGLDVAWVAVVDELRGTTLEGLPLVVGGRSSGARVACRTSAATDAVGVLCLAFPLRPPRRKQGAEPPSRLDELDAVTVPVLVVQGVRDPFGIPPAGTTRAVVEVSADHSLRTDLEAVRAAIGGWLRDVVP